MVEYLDEMDGTVFSAVGPTERPPTVLAALGPKMLRARGRPRRSGAHPYFTTPEHTAEAKAIVGSDRILAPEQMVVIDTGRRPRPRPGPPGHGAVPPGTELPQQPAAARLHRGRHGRGRQQPPGRRDRRVRRRGRRGRRASASTSTPAPRTCACRCSRTRSPRCPRAGGPISLPASASCSGTVAEARLRPRIRADRCGPLRPVLADARLNGARHANCRAPARR